jgi:hypothetical protein
LLVDMSLLFKTLIWASWPLLVDMSLLLKH